MVGGVDCRPTLTCVLLRDGLLGHQREWVGGEVAVEVARTCEPAVTTPAAVATSVLLSLVTATKEAIVEGHDHAMQGRRAALVAN